MVMRRPARTKPVRRPKAEKPANRNFRRDRLAAALALATAVCLAAAFLLSRDTQFLMPGPLASVHGAIENCSACHTKSGAGKLSWIHGLVAGNPRADSKACLTCHKMPKTAFNAHSASAEVLKESTDRLTKIAAATPQPLSARAQNSAFATHDVVARGLYCATCHQEHQGVHFNLTKIANEQCRSCHVVKFDSFDSHHPEFENYPFKRRTRIVYDHAGHFDKHFPEVAEKYPARRIPDTCSTCHDSRNDERVMAVAPFDKTCTTCHLDQIVGKERASGPKGIAFLTLPGLDVKTLKEKGAAIGEWPDASEAELSPFMKVMISRDERGQALIEAVGSVNLQDLSGASDDQIKAVTTLVWEIKRLFYALISGKASDVLADLNIGSGVKLSANLVTDLTASIPRDVVISAQQEWLPNLAAEIANGPKASEPEQGGWSTAIETASAEEPSDADAPEPDPDAGEEIEETASAAKLDPPVCTASILGQCLVFKQQTDRSGAAKTKAGAEEADSKEAETDDAASADASSEAEEGESADVPEDSEAAAAEKTETANAESDDAESADSTSAAEADADAPAGNTDVANAKPDDGKAAPAADEQPPVKGADQTDDLLSPNEEERRAIEAHDKHAENASPREGAAGDSSADRDAAAAELQTGAAPTVSIESDVDPESWAEYGGWYRQDYAIFYRPTGHKDKFIYAWLSLTGPQAPKGDGSPAAAVFDFLTHKDAQGSCTKCHSVDDVKGKGRLVNFSPPSVESKRGRFTNFIHEPHFQAVGIGQRIGILENRGCLTCHVLEKAAPGEKTSPYLKSYEQGNPQNFTSNFGKVKKDLCQTCHNVSTARQDCLLCHKYHVNGVNTPIMKTKIPSQ
jgi:hypothetical protein